MIHRIAATALTLIVAIATVTSALALEGLGETDPARQDPPPPAQPVPAPPAGAAVPKITIEVKAAPAAPGIVTEIVEVKSVTVAAPAKAQEQPVRVLKAAPAAKPVATRRAAPAAVKAVRINAAMVVNVAGNDAQARQYMQQFRPILRSEYHIVRAVCRPTPEQRQKLARAGELALRDAAAKYVDMMRRPMTPAQRADLDPRKQIREGLARAVKSILSAELSTRLQEEAARREASRKQLAVRNLVARLDRDLILGPDQRDKVAES